MCEVAFARCGVDSVVVKEQTRNGNKATAAVCAAEDGAECSGVLTGGFGKGFGGGCSGFSGGLCDDSSGCLGAGASCAGERVDRESGLGEGVKDEASRSSHGLLLGEAPGGAVSGVLGDAPRGSVARDTLLETGAARSMEWSGTANAAGAECAAGPGNGRPALEWLRDKVCARDSVPMGTMTAVRFGLMTDEAVRVHAACDVYNKNLYRKTHPRPHTVNDNAMGTVDRGLRCATCLNGMMECPGHFGEIKLRAPLYHPGFLENLLKLLRGVCFFCSRITARVGSGVSTRGVHEAYSSAGKARFHEHLASRRCAACPHCGAPQPQLRRVTQPSQGLEVRWRAVARSALRARFEACLHDVLACRSGDGSAQPLDPILENATSALLDEVVAVLCEPRFTAGEALDVLSALSDEDVRALGLDPVRGHPRDLVLLRLVVPPPAVRPSIMLFEGSKSRGQDDLTHLLQTVNKLNVQLEPGSFRNLRPPGLGPGDRDGPAASGVCAPTASAGGDLVRDFEQTCAAVLGGTLKTRFRALAVLALFAKAAASRSASQGARLAAAAREQMRKVCRAQLSVAQTPFGASALGASRTLADELQESVNDVMFGNGNVTGQQAQHKAKNLRQRLNGKEGRIRGNLNGKRVNNSARTVISPNPFIMPWQVGVPASIAQVLSVMETVNSLRLARMKRLVWLGPAARGGALTAFGPGGERYDLRTKHGRRQVLVRLGDGWRVARCLRDGDMVVFNRQPSLHKGSMMGHEVRVFESGETFLLNQACTAPYNADFDGDEMNVHSPVNEMGRYDVASLMHASRQIISGQSSRPCMGLAQDALVGGFLLSLPDCFLERAEYCQAAFQARAAPGFSRCVRDPPAIVAPRVLYTGCQLLSCLFRSDLDYRRGPLLRDGQLPDVRADAIEIRGGRLLYGVLKKSLLGAAPHSLVHVLCNEFSDEDGARFLANAQFLVNQWIKQCGFSVGLDDTRLPSEQHAALKRLLHTRIAGVEQFTARNARGGHSTRGALPSRAETVVQRALSGWVCQLGEALLDALPPDCALRHMVVSKSKGTELNIAQTMGAVGQNSVEGRRIAPRNGRATLPCFTPNDGTLVSRGFSAASFSDGLSPACFFFHQQAGREGVVDTNVKTSESGYIQRRLIKAMEGLVVQWDGSVRNVTGDVVQLLYGGDGLDPARVYMFQVPAGNVHELLRLNDVQRERCALMGMWDAEESLRLESEELARAFLRVHLSQCAASGRARDAVEVHAPFSPLAFVARVARACRFRHCRDCQATAAGSPAALCANELRQRAAAARGIDALIADLAATGFGVADPAMAVALLDNPLSAVRILLPSALIVRELTRGAPLCPACYDRALAALLSAAKERVITSRVAPGECVGAQAAMAIGEPATQLTMRTFHFAGIDSKNITLGLPALKEVFECARLRRAHAFRVSVRVPASVQRRTVLAAARRLCARPLSAYVVSVEPAARGPPSIRSRLFLSLVLDAASCQRDCVTPGELRLAVERVLRHRLLTVPVRVPLFAKYARPAESEIAAVCSLGELARVWVAPVALFAQEIRVELDPQPLPAARALRRWHASWWRAVSPRWPKLIRAWLSAEWLGAPEISHVDAEETPVPRAPEFRHRRPPPAATSSPPKPPTRTPGRSANDPQDAGLHGFDLVFALRRTMRCSLRWPVSAPCACGGGWMICSRPLVLPETLLRAVTRSKNKQPATAFTRFALRATAVFLDTTAADMLVAQVPDANPALRSRKKTVARSPAVARQTAHQAGPSTCRPRRRSPRTVLRDNGCVGTVPECTETSLNDEASNRFPRLLQAGRALAKGTAGADRADAEKSHGGFRATRSKLAADGGEGGCVSPNPEAARFNKDRNASRLAHFCHENEDNEAEDESEGRDETDPKSVGGETTDADEYGEEDYDDECILEDEREAELDEEAADEEAADEEAVDEEAADGGVAEEEADEEAENEVEDDEPDEVAGATDCRSGTEDEKECDAGTSDCEDGRTQDEEEDGGNGEDGERDEVSGEESAAGSGGTDCAEGDDCEDEPDSQDDGRGDNAAKTSDGEEVGGSSRFSKREEDGPSAARGADGSARKGCTADGSAMRAVEARAAYRRFLGLARGAGLCAERCASNGAEDVFAAFGIEATFCVLLHEINQVLVFDGSYVGHWHVALTADVMTYRGYPMKITRHGLNKLNTGPLMRSSFEETVDMLLEAALFTERDELTGPTEDIMLGRPPRIGSNFGAVSVDSDYAEAWRAQCVAEAAARSPLRCSDLALSHVPFLRFALLAGRGATWKHLSRSNYHARSPNNETARVSFSEAAAQLGQLLARGNVANEHALLSAYLAREAEGAGFRLRALLPHAASISGTCAETYEQLCLSVPDTALQTHDASRTPRAVPAETASALCSSMTEQAALAQEAVVSPDLAAADDVDTGAERDFVPSSPTAALFSMRSCGGKAERIALAQESPYARQENQTLTQPSRSCYELLYFAHVTFPQLYNSVSAKPEKSAFPEALPPREEHVHAKYYEQPTHSAFAVRSP